MSNYYTITFTINKNLIPKKEYFHQIDIWIKNVLLIKNINKIFNKNMEEELLSKVFILYNKFLHTLKIPIFTLPKILSIFNNEQSFEIKLSLEYIDYIPKKVFNEIFNLSLKYIIYFFIRHNSKENIINFNKTVKKELIQTFSYYSGASKSSIPILQTAFNMKISIFNLSRGISQLGWGSNSTMLIGSSVSNDSKIGARIVGDKMLTAILLKKAALPYPIHKLIFKENDCIPIAKKLSYPVVVKPNDESEGRGVIINISDDKKLKEAFHISKKASSSGQILIEKQVKGQCHRIFIVNQKILYVVKREPKSIQANGKNTIRELILKANEKNELLPIWEKTEFFPLDKETEVVLSKNNLNLKSVPIKNKWIPLRFIESSQYGGRNIDLTNNIHPKNKEIALKAARIFGMEVSGVDIISEDISIPWYENGAIINEVNFSPQLGSDEFSKNTIPLFLNSIIKNNGRIPITVIIGKEETLRKALLLQKSIPGSDISNNSNDEIISFLMDQHLKHLIIIVEKDELPSNYIVDKIDELIIIEKDINFFSKQLIDFYKGKILL